MSIKYVEGDLFQNVQDNGVVTVIPHICNNIGAWGAGFVVPLGKYYPEAQTQYLSLFRDRTVDLGYTQFVVCNFGVMVVNMIAQKGIGKSWEDGKEVPLIRYNALRNCMFDVRQKLKGIDPASVQIKCPMFGSGLAGGDWIKIEEMIYEIWNEFDVTIYYFPQFLPAGFNPVGRTDHIIKALIKKKESDSIDTTLLVHRDLTILIQMLEDHPWPHVNRHCEVQREECIKLLQQATEQVIELRKVLELQEIQERNLQ